MQEKANFTELEAKHLVRQGMEEFPITLLAASDELEELKSYIAQQKAKFAAQGKSADEVKLMIAELVNEKNSNNMTAFHFMGLQPNALEINKLLISNGANVNVADSANILPIHTVSCKMAGLAKSNEQKYTGDDLIELKEIMLEDGMPILDLYISLGVSYTAKDCDNKSAMDYLCSAATPAELNAQFAAQSLPHLQKAVNEYYASQNSVAAQVQQQPPERASSPVQELKTSAKHAGKIAKERACPANTNKKACCIVM